MSDERQGGKARQSTYTQTQINSYERNFSAMSFTMVNGSGLITLSPIFDEFVGKEPKKGDSVYDHEEKMNFLIEPQAAIQLRNGIRMLQEQDELKSFGLQFGSEKTRSTLTIFKPETLKLQKVTFPNYILKLTKMKDDAEEKLFHVLQTSTSLFKNTENEEMEDTIEVDLELLVEFANAVIQNGFCGAYHGARRNGMSAPSGGGGGYNKTRRRTVEEDEGDDGGEEAAPARTSARTSSSPAAKTPARRSSLKDEFAEE
jgi:hypothetical protein